MDKAMERFFNQALGKEAFEEDASRGQKVYAQLVQYRFEEVITKAFPLLTREVDTTLLNKAIVAFMHQGTQSPYIWEVPRYFWEFEKEHHLINLPFVDDLMWYEWIEVELMMATYAPPPKEPFSWENAWYLDESVRIRKLHYRVFESAFTQQSPCFFIAWFDHTSRITCYKEVAEVIYRLLELLTCKPWHESLACLAHEADVSVEVLQTYLNEAMLSLCEEGIIITDVTLF